MKFEQQYRNAQLLFGFSLILLLGFLGVWLQYVYQDKAEEFENQVSYIWLKSIKDIESKDFSKLIITTINSRTDSIVSLDSVVHVNHLLEEASSDSNYTMSISANYAIDSRTDYEEIKLVIDTSSTATFIGRTPSFKSYDSVIRKRAQCMPPSFKSLTDNIKRDVSSFIQQFALDIDLVKEKLDSNLQQANLDIDYEIQDLEQEFTPLDSLNPTDKFYVRTATGSAFTLKIEPPMHQLWSSMWLECLMGLFLLSVISAAFYYMLHHLKAQHQLVQMKNDFISNITHELRTPIFTVSAALEALDNFNGLDNPERTKEYLGISKNELNRLSILVEKVLKTSLFEQSALQITKEHFALEPLIQRIVNSFKLQLEKENAAITVTNYSSNLQAYADKIHLTNVIYNLIDNALKYRSAQPPKINIKLNDQNQQLQIIVSDNGIGISEAYVGQIFNKFFRVPTGDLHNVKGYGLGLNYTANIIELHGGTIVVNSQLDKGSTFTITLPQSTSA